MISALLGLILIIIAKNGFKADFRTIIISMLSGIMLVVGMFTKVEALKQGTVALTSLFGTAGILVPCIAGIYLFDTPITGMQWLGLLLFIISACLMIINSKRVFNGFNIKTFLLLLGELLSNGMVMLAQQMFTVYVPAGDVSVFSFLSFGIVGLFMLVTLPLVTKGSEEKIEKLPGKLMVYGIALSIAVFVINQLATLATALIPPVILFTFINGGSTIIAAIVASVIFKEKITLQSAFAIVLGIISLVIIKIG